MARRLCTSRKCSRNTAQRSGAMSTQRSRAIAFYELKVGIGNIHCFQLGWTREQRQVSTMVKAAAVQIGPVLYSREGTIERWSRRSTS
jgi:hypothetical protein